MVVLHAEQSRDLSLVESYCNETAKWSFDSQAKQKKKKKKIKSKKWSTRRIVPSSSSLTQCNLRRRREGRLYRLLQVLRDFRESFESEIKSGFESVWETFTVVRMILRNVPRTLVHILEKSSRIYDSGSLCFSHSSATVFSITVRELLCTRKFGSMVLVFLRGVTHLWFCVLFYRTTGNLDS